MKISADRMRLYAVTDRSWLKGGETLEKAVQAALAGGSHHPAAAGEARIPRGAGGGGQEAEAGL